MAALEDCIFPNRKLTVEFPLICLEEPVKHAAFVCSSYFKWFLN